MSFYLLHSKSRIGTLIFLMPKAGSESISFLQIYDQIYDQVLFKSNGLLALESRLQYCALPINLIMWRSAPVEMLLLEDQGSFSVSEATNALIGSQALACHNVPFIYLAPCRFMARQTTRSMARQTTRSMARQTTRSMARQTTRSMTRHASIVSSQKRIGRQKCLAGLFTACLCSNLLPRLTLYTRTSMRHLLILGT